MSDMTGDFRALFSTLFLAFGRKFPRLSTRRGMSTLVLGTIAAAAIALGVIVVYVILTTGTGPGITTTYP